MCHLHLRDSVVPLGKTVIHGALCSWRPRSSAGNPGAPQCIDPLTFAGYTDPCDLPTPNPFPGLASPLAKIPAIPLPVLVCQARRICCPVSCSRRSWAAGNMPFSNKGISRLLQHPHLSYGSQNWARCWAHTGNGSAGAGTEGGGSKHSSSLLFPNLRP